jgi:guanylate kinase
MNKGHIFLIGGPSGVGKSSTIKHLLDHHSSYAQIPSYTTRQPRQDDKDTNCRIFVSQEEFKKLADNNELVDWIEFSNHFYGKKKCDIISALEVGKIILIDTENRGIAPYKKTFPNITLIFMKYRDLNDLRNRLKTSRPDISEEEIQRRFAIAQKEMEAINLYDYVITTINGDPPAVPAKKIEKIINNTIANQESPQV